jgi:hypothetical protein
VALRELHCSKSRGRLMPGGAIADYARILCALPGTAKQIAKRTGIQADGVRIIARRLWWLGLMHPGRVRAAGLRHPAEAIWMLGDGPVAPGLRINPPRRPLVQHIAFAHLVRALEGGATRPELHRLTGLHRTAVARVIRAFGPRLHIAEWELDSVGRPVAVWQFGRKPNAPKPKPPSESQKAQRYEQRKVWRALAQQGVVV